LLFIILSKRRSKAPKHVWDVEVALRRFAKVTGFIKRGV